MECAGFLSSFGNKVSIMHRGKILRGFDEDCVAKVTDFM